MSLVKKLLTIFLISMLPVVELRGALPVAAAPGMDLPFLLSYTVSVLGNILPVPFLILFAKKILMWCVKIPKIGKFFQKIIEKADKKASEIGTYELWGLFCFVAIPLPGTGAWTGSLIAAILRLRMWKAFLVISLGVMTSGIIMGFLSYGLFDILAALF